METLFLSAAEVVELTGRKLSTSQCRWLSDAGYPFALNANRHPKVARAYVLARLGATHQLNDVPTLVVPRPNFAALARAA